MHDPYVDRYAGAKRSWPLVLLPIVAGSALCWACPGEVQDPQRFNLGPECNEVETLVFSQRCGSVACHEFSKPAAGLDLATGGVAERLLAARSESCSDRPLVDTSAPGQSFLVTKLGATVRCGARMPLAREPLTDDEVGCVVQWIRRLADQPPGDGSADSQPLVDAAADVTTSDTATTDTTAD